MALRSLAAAALAFVLLQSSSHAQSRPNLSGTWTLTVKSGVCPAGSLTLLQDESSLRVHGSGAARESIYKFDGTDMREDLAPAPPRPADMPPGAYVAQKTKSVARGAWNGDQFVVVTHTTMTVTWPNQASGQFDRETTRRDTYSSDPQGRLIVESRVVVDPLPGGTDRRLDLPDSWTCAYARAGDPKRDRGLEFSASQIR